MAPTFKPAKSQEKLSSENENQDNLGNFRQQPVPIASRSFEQAFRKIDDVLRKGSFRRELVNMSAANSWN